MCGAEEPAWTCPRSFTGWSWPGSEIIWVWPGSVMLWMWEGSWVVISVTSFDPPMSPIAYVPCDPTRNLSLKFGVVIFPIGEG